MQLAEDKVLAPDGSVVFDFGVSGRLAWAANGPFKKTLHLGCGWIRFKSDPENIHHAHDQSGDNLDYTFNFFDTPWPIEDDAYDRVTAMHVVEHLPIDRVVAFFTEVARIMRPGGVFIIEVPDAAAILKEAQYNYGHMEVVMGHDRYQGDQHRWHYYGPDLVALLHNSGFDRTFTREGLCYHRAQLGVIRVEATKYGSNNWAKKREEENSVAMAP